MAENETVARLRSQFAAAVTDVSVFRDETTVTIARDHLIPVCRFLHDDPDLAFVFLVDLTSVDYLEYAQKQARFGVLYLLHSYKSNERIRLRVWVDEDDALVPSVTGIWRGANWLEREVFDLMGISFSGHPDLRRILLSAEFVGNPLRKDFPVFGDQEPIVRVKGFRENFEK
jgi:NADH-quinone oxidoreductase subunit C